MPFFRRGDPASNLHLSCGDVMNGNGRTVSLVLGSGGAKGLAHIGVIQVLEEKGFQIRSISGSSIGALIGGLYVAGRLDPYTQWVCTLERRDVIRLLDFSFGGSALFKGKRILNRLKKMIGDCRIEDLPISFTAVATDLQEGKEVWLARGSLFEAIAASIAFPTLFAPFNYNGRNLVDGGLLNPVPIAPTLRDMTDLTIAVNVNSKAPICEEYSLSPKAVPADRNKFGLPTIWPVDALPKRAAPLAKVGLFDTVSMVLDTMQSAISHFKLANYTPDVLIEIPKDICTIYEFERAKEVIQIGRRKTEETLGSYLRSQWCRDVAP